MATISKNTLLVCAATLVFNVPGVQAANVFQAIKENFFTESQRTANGPKVRTGFKYYEAQGYYATSNAVFVEQGYTHDLNLGYAGAVDAVVYGLNLDVTQSAFDAHRDYYNFLKVYSGYKNIEVRYETDYREEEIKLQYGDNIGPWQLRAGLGQSQVVGRDATNYDFRYMNLYRQWRDVSINADIRNKGDEHNQKIELNHKISSSLSQGMQIQNDDKTRTISHKGVLEYPTVSYAAYTTYQQRIGDVPQWVHSLNVKKTFNALHATLNISDRSADFADSSVQLHYERVLDL